MGDATRTPLVEVAVFDVDGTLIDSNDGHAEAWEIVFAQFGHTIPAARVRPHIGKGGDQLMPEFLSPAEIKAHGKDISEARKTVVKERFMPGFKPFPEVRDLFLDLRARGIRLALASSASAEELEGYKEIAGIGDLLDEQTTSDDASSSKPEPDIFQAVLKRLGKLPIGCILVVGDTPYDATAAAKAGLKTLCVRCGGFPESDLRGAGAVAVYQDPADLRRNLAKAFQLRAATGPAGG